MCLVSFFFCLLQTRSGVPAPVRTPLTKSVVSTNTIPLHFLDREREMAPLKSLEREYPIIDSSFQQFCASHGIFSGPFSFLFYKIQFYFFAHHFGSTVVVNRPHWWISSLILVAPFWFNLFLTPKVKFHIDQVLLWISYFFIT